MIYVRSRVLHVEIINIFSFLIDLLVILCNNNICGD
nr:MAG TPA: hypothetical protein [Bacteriophage sp.]